MTLSPLSFCRAGNDFSLFGRGLEILMLTVMAELCNDAMLKTPTLTSRWSSFLPFLKQDESHDWQEARAGRHVSKKDCLLLQMLREVRVTLFPPQHGSEHSQAKLQHTADQHQ